MSAPALDTADAVLQALRWLVDVLMADAEPGNADALQAYEAAMVHALKVLAQVDGVPPGADAARAHLAQIGGRHA